MLGFQEKFNPIAIILLTGMDYFFCKFDKNLVMAVNDLKKELLSYIENTNDEELLFLLKEDFKFYSKSTGIDITNDLSEAQFEDLQALSEEDEAKDTHTLEEFKKATDKWRIR